VQESRTRQSYGGVGEEKGDEEVKTLGGMPKEKFRVGGWTAGCKGRQVTSCGEVSDSLRGFDRRFVSSKESVYFLRPSLGTQRQRMTQRKGNSG